MAARKAKDTQNPKAGGGAGDTETGDEPPITIKKYANRRLYNTATSSYVTLDHLCQMVKDGVDFAVYDAKSGEDITRSVLTQIIVEEEGKTGQNLLPISFLRQLIAFYGDNAQQMMLPQYLDLSIRSFAENQEKMRDYMKDTLGSVFPFDQLEEVGKQNMAMFEKTMQLFSPFGGVGQSGGSPDNDRTEEGARKDAEKEVDALEKELAELRRELDALKSQKK